MDGPCRIDVGSSLADQPGSLAIALGANLGDPLATLVAVRPQLELLLRQFAASMACGGGAVRWSPLFRTEPMGGPAGQPSYLNAVLLLEGCPPPVEAVTATAAAQGLLADLHGLERRFGRQRRERWGPRSLDLDLLWWGNLRLSTPELTLPHPRMMERSFVLVPLAALLCAGGQPPLRLPGREGWWE
jgi:2-amino-4-hydroxy-6-hydroxymethyldihydropteridine diphosphokinase